ncbi:MAG: hypothetical protein K8I00_02215 [Candidatus Omnitrophica bacterium]|nr:hypothetical protein [Candidatus Omnitrophota bacterium]
MSERSQPVKESPLFWPAKLRGSTLRVLDETPIALKMAYINVTSTAGAVKVIKQMKTRAFGQFLVVLNTFLLEMNRNPSLSDKALLSKLRRTAEQLNNSRPTFPFAEVTSIVIRWAQTAISDQRDVRPAVTAKIEGYLAGVRQQRLQRVQRIAELLENGDSVLTHCNVSGELAMAAYLAKTQHKNVHFFATETRPYMQGAKLTSWEMKRLGAEVTLIADNAVGSVMSDGLVSKVIVGSDRSCANGDFANKIGTYQIAVLAKEFGIPFYVLTQPSDKIPAGEDIPIEIRNAQELLTYYKKKVVTGVVKGFYPGFDVIPHELVTDTIAIKVN